MRAYLPFLAPIGVGALLALYLAVAYDDSRAGWIAAMLLIAGVTGALGERTQSADRALGPQLASQVGGQSLELRWAEEILGPWWQGPLRPVRWIVAREESWGSVFLVRVEVGKHDRETQLVVSVQGPELPNLSARRKGAAQRELVGALEEWDVSTGEPAPSEQLVSWIVQAVQPLGVAVFQLDGRKLWCRLRDPGPSYLGDNSAQRQQLLAMAFARAAELGRELHRLRR